MYFYNLKDNNMTGNTLTQRGTVENATSEDTLDEVISPMWETRGKIAWILEAVKITKFEKEDYVNLFDKIKDLTNLSDIIAIIDDIARFNDGSLAISYWESNDIYFGNDYSFLINLRTWTNIELKKIIFLLKKVDYDDNEVIDFIKQVWFTTDDCSLNTALNEKNVKIWALVNLWFYK